MDRLHEKLTDSKKARDAATTTCRGGVLERDTPLAKLQDYLAAVVLVTRTDCVVTVAIEGWGFKTVASKARGV